MLCTFSLRNRLRAAAACNFSSLISPDVSAPAALASLLFNPPEPQNHEKTQCFPTFLPFRAPASSFFWSFLFWLFSLLTAFSSLHIVGSLTSKLPSPINIPQMLAYIPYMDPMSNGILTQFDQQNWSWTFTTNLGYIVLSQNTWTQPSQNEKVDKQFTRWSAFGGFDYSWWASWDWCSGMLIAKYGLI